LIRPLLSLMAITIIHWLRHYYFHWLFIIITIDIIIG
jgi:hypothetical protein